MFRNKFSPASPPVNTSAPPFHLWPAADPLMYRLPSLPGPCRYYSVRAYSWPAYGSALSLNCRPGAVVLPIPVSSHISTLMVAPHQIIGNIACIKAFVKTQIEYFDYKLVLHNIFGWFFLLLAANGTFYTVAPEPKILVSTKLFLVLFSIKAFLSVRKCFELFKQY
jgi:hypothetical protein